MTLPWLLIVAAHCALAVSDDARPFGIQVIDDSTQHGIPLVELTTVDDVTWITDSAGCVAIEEPQLIGQTVFLRIDAPGYEVPRDGFGIGGVRVQPQSNQIHTIKLKRNQSAERWSRMTGRDRFRDAERLGLNVPADAPLGRGRVVGQDSVQTAIYKDRMYWFWGDTNRLSYPLGLYRTAGATSDLPVNVDLADGLELNYFTDDSGFARAMVDVADKTGVVWIHGVCTVSDSAGNSRMVAQYSRRHGLDSPLEQGLVLWNDERQIFEVLRQVDLGETWRMLSDHPIRIIEDGVAYLEFGNPFPVVRVPATLNAIQDRSAYQAWSCRANGDQPLSRDEIEAAAPERDANGRLVWKWRSGPPVTQADEQRWLKASQITTAESRFLPRDWSNSRNDDRSTSEPQRLVVMHSGTVRFNAHRQRWVMIAIEHAWDRDSPSFLGEVFYSEAESPQGPFTRAVKIATHPGQSFYNPCHHDVFDQDGGRVIWFEGTYCNTFTKSPPKPRYNYNQLLYRLDLDAPLLKQVFR